MQLLAHTRVTVRTMPVVLIARLHFPLTVLACVYLTLKFNLVHGQWQESFTADPAATDASFAAMHAAGPRTHGTSHGHALQHLSMTNGAAPALHTARRLQTWCSTGCGGSPNHCNTYYMDCPDPVSSCACCCTCASGYKWQQTGSGKVPYGRCTVAPAPPTPPPSPPPSPPPPPPDATLLALLEYRFREGRSCRSSWARRPSTR